MSDVVVVTEENRDDMSRKAGIFLYSDTRLWLDGNVVHRTDGPAIVSPDGVERWYVHGKDISRDVRNFFLANKWPLKNGLDSSEKQTLFAAEFLR